MLNGCFGFAIWSLLLLADILFLNTPVIPDLNVV